MNFVERVALKKYPLGEDELTEHAMSMLREAFTIGWKTRTHLVNSLIESLMRADEVEVNDEVWLYLKNLKDAMDKADEG